MRAVGLAAAFCAVQASATAQTDAPPLQPKVYSRRSWCKEPLGQIPMDIPKLRIVVHHTAFFVTDAEKKLTGRASWDAAVAHAGRVQFLHRHIRGWKFAAYHYMIDWEGRIFEGRPVDLLGAHTEHHNTGSIGVVLMGDFSKQRLTPAQAKSLKALLDWLMHTYEIPVKEIHGHYFHKSTACPGTFLNGIWDPKSTGVDYIQLHPAKNR